MSAWNEYASLKKVAVRTPLEAFQTEDKITAQWRALRFHARPDFGAAIAEHRAFVRMLLLAGADVVFLPTDPDLTLDAIFVRDAAIATPKGFILCRMGRKTRRAEPAIHGRQLGRILGKIEPPGTLEGGDFIWLDENTCAAGLGPRTNEAGIERLKALLGKGVEVHTVPLPAPAHREDVFHLMSMISPVDKDLAVIYRPLMPRGFLKWLAARGMEFVEVPEQEWPLMACNVLALAPRRVLMLDRLPQTKELLEDKGCKVQTYRGDEISRKGDGGPTCLTRPLVRG